MLETPAVVRGIHAGHVSVEPQLQSGCGACAPTGCATRRLAGLFRSRERFAVATNEVFSPGERVMIVVDERAFLAASFRAYIIPLLLMLLGAVLAGAFSAGRSGDLAGAFGALAGLVLGGALQRFRCVSQGAGQVTVRRRPFEQNGAALVHHRADPLGIK